MIEAFRKIWQFAGAEKKNINKSVAVGFLNAVLQMFQVAAIYFVVLALTDGTQGGKTAWLALICEPCRLLHGSRPTDLDRRSLKERTDGIFQ